MRNLLLITFIFVYLTGYTQDTQDSTTRFIIRDAIYTRRDTDTIYYLDSSINFSGKFSRFAKHGRVEGFANSHKGLKILMIFSRSELKDLDQKSQRQASKIWSDLFFLNSVRSPSDSLSNFWSYKKSPGYLKERWFYFFSQPIFIRNGTVAIFRLVEMIGPSAGNDLYFVYIKNGNNWSQKMTVWAGAW